MSKSKLRFTDVSTEYMEFRKPELRPTTYASYMHLLKRRIIPVVGSVKIKDFNNDVLQGFVDAESAAGYGKHGIRDCVSIIKLVLRYAADMKYGKYKIRTIKYHRGCSDMRREHFLTKDEYNKLLTYCMENPGERTFPTLIAMTTGMRIGEVCGLKYGDVDYKNLTISVTRSIKRVCVPDMPSELEISSPKTQSSIRMVPILPEVARLLERTGNSDEVYISSGRDKPLEPRSYRAKYNRILARLGIEHHTFHDLRHTFASRCINSGADARTVADILGHTNVEMTLNTYTHSTDERRRAVAMSACRMQ